MLDESFSDVIDLVKGTFSGRTITTTSMLLLLGIASLVPSELIARELKGTKFTKEQLFITIEKCEPSKSYFSDNNQYTGTQIANILALTLFGEGANQSLAGKKAIMSVIWNRAGEDVNNIPMVCFQKFQFSMWNSSKPSSSLKYLPEKYTLSLPPSRLVKSHKNGIYTVNPIEFKSWMECVNIAEEVVKTGKFKSTIGTRTLYLNKTACGNNLPDWADLCTLQVGDHWFGYDKRQLGKHYTKKFKDYNSNMTKLRGANSPKQVTYDVKDGDTLYGIATKHKTTVDKIKALNPQIKSNTIYPKQKIRVK